jgi:hypothetical protein
MAPDWRDRRPCTCGFPKQWRGHDVPELPPEAAEIDARILGETHAGAERVRQELAHKENPS